MSRGQRQQRAKEKGGKSDTMTNQQEGELGLLVGVGKLYQLYKCSAPRDHTIPLDATTLEVVSAPSTMLGVDLS